MSSITGEYRLLLESWVPRALPWMHIPSSRPDLECYGTGYDAWGVQTNQKAMSALAVLSTDPELDEVRIGMSRDELTEHAKRLLRFSLESHKVGTFRCTDGRSWGHTWISALGIERMMHAVDELEGVLTDSDRDLLRRVLCSECDWLTDCYVRSASGEPGVIKAGLVSNNDPESNLWNGVLLCRTAMMYPDAPRAAEYWDKGLSFILAGISIEEDAESDEVVDGVRVGDRYIGANFFPSYALDHHAYLNVGYMVICLSQVAMAHFGWKRRGLDAPQAVYRHVEELWRIVKQFTFADGRLARIGGDSRARYCYCQDYAVPTWILMQDRFGDADCAAYEAAWLRTLGTETAAGDGGSFLAARLSDMAEYSPTYYTRLESDRACALSMALSWRRLFETQWQEGAADARPSTTGAAPSTSGAASNAGAAPNAGAAANAGAAPNAGAAKTAAADTVVWSDDYHGATFVRGARRLASWTWRAAELPQGLCVPSDRSDMAEWRWNMAGRVLGVGARNVCEVVDNGGAVFDGGFVNAGVVQLRSESNLAEGEADKYIATETIACAALPDEATVVVIQYAAAVERAFLRSVKPIYLLLPNDIFNQSSRVYATAAGARHVSGADRETPSRSTDETIVDLASTWVSVDDCMTVATLTGEPLQLVRPVGRQVTIRDKPFEIGSIYADEICAGVLNSTQSFDTGRPVLDTAFTVRVGETASAARRRAFASGDRYIVGDGYRAALVAAVDGPAYLLVVGLPDAESRETTLALPGGRSAAVSVSANHARLYAVGPDAPRVVGDTGAG